MQGEDEYTAPAVGYTVEEYTAVDFDQPPPVEIASSNTSLESEDGYIVPADGYTANEYIMPEEYAVVDFEWESAAETPITKNELNTGPRDREEWEEYAVVDFGGL